MKVLFVSLGCDKNLSDTEHMIGRLVEAGHEIVDDEDQAEAIVINTCCFIRDARDESVDTILEMSEKRKNGKCRILIITGCLAQRYQHEIRETLPEVDAVLGTMSTDSILEALNAAENKQPYEEFRNLSELPDEGGPRELTTGGHFAYLKIAEGCDKRCTYCIIPELRGPYRSVPMETLVREASELAGRGVRELILVAQETSLYGKDLYGEKSLHILLKKLCSISGIRWIRILYCYPEEIYDGLIEVMAGEEKICHYLDMPIQHASDRILKRMGRRTSQAELSEKIRTLRERIPDIILRTTLITGFPGESEEDHECLKQFIEETRFDRLGVFCYSAEEGTPAAGFPDQIGEEIKEARRDELMLLQQDISEENGDERIGSELLVMIEGKVSGEDAYIGRSYMDAPNVDGYVFVQTPEILMTGDFVRTVITGSTEYDLIGRIAD